MTRIAIYGASGFGREVAWLVESCEGLEAVCFIDDDEAKLGKELNGLPVVGLNQAKAMFSWEGTRFNWARGDRGRTKWLY